MAAEPPCSGMSCMYKDPKDTGCANLGAGNLASFYYSGSVVGLQGTLLELRRSTGCNAAWARITGGNCLVWECGALIEASTNKSTIIDWNWTPIPRGGQNWSSMMSFTYWVRACFVQPQPGSFPDYQRLACTAWK